MPVNPVQSEEEAQAAFAGLYDGDYAFMDLYDREHLRAGLTYLHAQAMQAAKSEPPRRRATFRGQDGHVSEVSRSAPRVPDIASVSLHDVVVIVRNGRVEGFTGTG